MEVGQKWTWDEQKARGIWFAIITNPIMDSKSRKEVIKMVGESKVIRVFGDSHSTYYDDNDFARNVFVLFDDDSYELVKLNIADREADRNKDVDRMIYEMGKHLKGKTKKEISDYIDNFPDSYMDEYKKYYQKLSEET